jgi:hypothetical protein
LRLDDAEAVAEGVGVIAPHHRGDAEDAVQHVRSSWLMVPRNIDLTALWRRS